MLHLPLYGVHQVKKHAIYLKLLFTKSKSNEAYITIVKYCIYWIGTGIQI